MQRNQALLDLIRDVAEGKGATSAQIVLAWELAQRPFIIPIPGTTKMSRLEENPGAAEVSLSENELTAINAALATIEVDETHF